MNLPTPEEMARKIERECWDCSGTGENIDGNRCPNCVGEESVTPTEDEADWCEAAIRADREAIAKVVEEEWRTIVNGTRQAPLAHHVLWELIALLRQQNKKGEPPLDDSPTAPLV